MARKQDCICKWSVLDRDGLPTKPTHIYDPRCPFHKAPDRGYGYDSWGQPNDKYSERAGRIGATVVGLCLLGIVAFGIYMAVKW